MYRILLIISSTTFWGCSETGLSTLNNGTDGATETPIDTGIWDREDEDEDPVDRFMRVSSGV